MDALLHRIEALPGDDRYAVTFRRADGSEQSAVAQLELRADGDAHGSEPVVVRLAEASLPVGWTQDSPAARAVLDAVRALDAARRLVPRPTALHDVDGGWDVGLGNVVLDAAGVPTCTADGPMQPVNGVWACPECGAKALLG